MEGICKVCGCTDLDCSNCIEKTGFACSWVTPYLCSACVGDIKEVSVTYYFKDAAGFSQKLIFETDLMIGIDEDNQVISTAELILQEKGFLNTVLSKHYYKILQDI